VRYSVYNHDTKLYDYYDGPGPSGTHAGAPPSSLGRSQYGATVEQLAWKVPTGARKVGSGDIAQGRVASMGGLAGLGDIASGDIGKVAAVGVIAYLAWRHLR